ncbi:hypothetical protein [Tomitella gaofuii]|uniref:hypothetical protein n=1 Tax=Tomitella gaofuii TaxID=2760083 RepID=UPI0015FDDD66|nr:hypothetical protein [Tomitella gaofuii]
MATTDKKKPQPKLLTEEERSELAHIAERGGLKGANARAKLGRDAARRGDNTTSSAAAEWPGLRLLRRGPRGYRGAGGGTQPVVPLQTEYRTTNAQVAGAVYPWTVGAGAPLVGTPVGKHLTTGAPVCFDPLNWQVRGGFITAAVCFILALNGYGKSSLVRRMVLGSIAQGSPALILGDTKPDYVDLVEEVGGQVIRLGYGTGTLNPLAVGALGAVLPQIGHDPELYRRVAADVRARQVLQTCGLVELVRREPVADYEETLIATGLDLLYTPQSDGGYGFTPDQAPIIADLADVVAAGAAPLRDAVAAVTDDEYRSSSRRLLQSLRALIRGRFGEIFNGQTSEPLDLGRPAVCVDISQIPESEPLLLAAVLMTCWSDGLGAVEAAHVLADAGLAPKRTFSVVMDEMWRVIRAGGAGMVDRIDALTRLSRTVGVSLTMISHSVKDLESLGSEADVKKALGFIERARAKILGPLPPEELDRLTAVMSFSATERAMITSWASTEALSGPAPRSGERPLPPGTGKFLLKVGESGQPGIPFQVVFTDAERSTQIHNTNKRFSDVGRARQAVLRSV